MSTLNVANISDDQSTLSNSANPSDNLNNTTTVDTKYVTNGCAKAFANVPPQIAATLNYSFNISSGVDNSTGNYTLSFTTGFSNNRYPTPSTAQNGKDVCVTVTTMTTTSFVLKSFGQDGDSFDTTIHTVSFGELA